MGFWSDYIKAITPPPIKASDICCANCRWWQRSAVGDTYGSCQQTPERWMQLTAPVPAAWSIWNSRRMQGRDGASCRAFERKE